MQPGSFSRPVVVREWPSRHCFISLPRPWASLTLPAPTPTFRLEVSEERSVLLSWAGELHNPNPGDENTILIGREVLRSSGILDGAFGIITQVQVPPPCSSVTVHVGSLTEWQDLALNAEVAQSAFLNQVRVLGLGQSLPLWLEGGVRITLTVARIDPPHDCGILQPMTQVEVLPPTEQEESEGFRPINFTPTAMESFDKDKSDDESLSMGKTVKYSENTSNCDALDVRNQTNLDQNSFEMLMKYLTFRLQQQRITSESTTKKDFSYGYRVVPIPQAEDSPLCDLLSNHPSLVVVSKQSLVYVEHQNKTSFLARIKKIYSPKEKAEKLVAVREEDKAAETKQQGVSVANSANKKSGDKFCTVIVWENFVESKEENTKFVNEMRSIIKGNTCVISDCLRRLMKLEILSIVELNSRDINVKSLPVTIDVSPLMPVTNSGIVCDTLKRMLKDFVDETHVVVNAVTLLNVKIDDKNLDVFVTVRDGVPLKLSKESVVLLEVTHVSNPSDLPHISSSIVDLRSKFTPRFQYVGSEEVLLALQRHILLGSGSLLQQYKGVPQFALLHGSKGLGKTSLVETIAENLSGFPYFLHFQIISFKHLKGKKMETVEKKLQSIFREAIFRRPSVIVLEDLDSLVPSKRIEDQESGPLHDHTMQMVNMLKGLLDDLLEFCHADDDLFPSDNPKRGGVMVVATAVLRTSVHPLLVNPQGCHYFPCSFGIPPLESEGRVRALNAMISVYLKNSTFHQGARSAECCVGSSRREDSDGVSLRKCNRIETNLAMKLTENFVLPDLSHLALRTFLQARHRWEGNDKQCRCIKCGSVIENRSQSTSSSLLSLAVSENNNDLRNDLSVVDGDLEAARQGYIPLALRGLDLSEKKTNGTMKVGGLAEACKTLKETLTWPSTYPNLFSKVKLRLRSGVLLYGPPGCGKTLIANSVAENCQLNFISVKGPELLSKYIGASEQAVRDAFERASSAKPCILFFDEFESIAPRRGHDNTGVTDRVVNQLLTQMDGVEGLTGVYVLAATSRPDLIDPALLRPGRLDKCVFCPMPSLADREDILRILSEDIDLGEEIDWGEIASTTENHSGADLQSLLSTAQILVAQEALGDALYEGVIPPDRKQDRDVTAVLPSCEEILSHDDLEEPHDEANSLVQVALEKEKVKFTQRRFSSQEDTSVIVTQEDSTNTEDTEDTISHSSSLNQSSECHSQSHGEEHAEKRLFKVFKRHIEASLKEVKPSVTATERQKYERLYSSFSKSRDGNFGKHSPGKRATLA